VVHAADAHGLCADDVVAGIAPLHFDMSTLELYVAPFVGAAVAPVADPVLRFAASVVAHTVRHQATVWYLVPSLLTSMIEANLLSTESVPSLRLVAYAGEPYPGPKVAALVERLPGVRIQNAYGPAETNVVSVYDVGPDTAFHDAVPLGWAWSGAVFDVRGDNSELWLAADTMMQGYLGRPDLTAERMETDSRGQRWYRSGDVVRLTDDGWVFAGRVDHQIKLRGVRLELEALEALLEGLDGVSVAVVAGYPADQPVELVAGIVATDAASSGVAAQARRVLPASATPIEITRLSEVPNTQSGKVDRSRIRTSLRQRKAADQPVATQPVATQPVAEQITHESPA
jgi:acyl-coenzyme A synthetase/AMP-(fatty) acid ligase